MSTTSICRRCGATSQSILKLVSIINKIFLDLEWNFGVERPVF
jgi:hypothetical protein